MRPSLTAPIPNRLIAVAAAALVLPLAACSKGPEVSATNASTKEVAEKVAAATGGEAIIQPGRWEGTYTMHDMEIPGMANMPPAAREQMKAQMQQTRQFVNCVSEEDVKKQKAFYMGDENKNCTYDHFTMGGGKIDAAMTCNSGREGAMAMTMTGSYSPDSYRMDMTGKGQGAGPTAGMNMKFSVEARRVGACKGTKDEL